MDDEEEGDREGENAGRRWGITLIAAAVPVFLFAIWLVSGGTAWYSYLTGGVVAVAAVSLVLVGFRRLRSITGNADGASVL